MLSIDRLFLLKEMINETMVSSMSDIVMVDEELYRFLFY